jgi:hypothetical protein
VVRQRHVPRRRHLAAADQAYIGDGVMRGAKRAGRDQRRAGAGAASDAVEARGLEGLGQAHRRQEGGEPPRQPRRARPRGAEHEEIMNRTPASASLSPQLPRGSGDCKGAGPQPHV